MSCSSGWRSPRSAASRSSSSASATSAASTSGSCSGTSSWPGSRCSSRSLVYDRYRRGTPLDAARAGARALAPLPAERAVHRHRLRPSVGRRAPRRSGSTASSSRPSPGRACCSASSRSTSCTQSSRHRFGGADRLDRRPRRARARQRRRLPRAGEALEQLGCAHAAGAHCSRSCTPTSPTRRRWPARPASRSR